MHHCCWVLTCRRSICCLPGNFMSRHAFAPGVHCAMIFGCLPIVLTASSARLGYRQDAQHAICYVCRSQARIRRAAREAAAERQGLFWEACAFVPQPQQFQRTRVSFQPSLLRCWHITCAIIGCPMGEPFEKVSPVPRWLNISSIASGHCPPVYFCSIYCPPLGYIGVTLHFEPSRAFKACHCVLYNVASVLASANESLTIWFDLQGKCEIREAVRRAARRCKSDCDGGRCCSLYYILFLAEAPRPYHSKQYAYYCYITC